MLLQTVFGTCRRAKCSGPEKENFVSRLAHPSFQTTLGGGSTGAQVRFSLQPLLKGAGQYTCEEFPPSITNVSSPPPAERKQSEGLLINIGKYLSEEKIRSISE